MTNLLSFCSNKHINTFLDFNVEYIEFSCLGLSYQITHHVFDIHNDILIFHLKENGECNTSKYISRQPHNIIFSFVWFYVEKGKTCNTFFIVFFTIYSLIRLWRRIKLLITIHNWLWSQIDSNDVEKPKQNYKMILLALHTSNIVFVDCLAHLFLRYF